MMSTPDQSSTRQPLHHNETDTGTEDKDAPEGQPQEAEPITTGDMQAVGATSPEEVQKRRNVAPDEAPVEESPGDQMSG